MNATQIVKAPTPYAFDKRVRKSIVAAETVLGPKAVKRLIVGLIMGFEGPYSEPNEIITELLAAMFSFVDGSRQVVIETGAGQVRVTGAPLNYKIKGTYEGFTLVDLKASLAAGICSDPMAVILELLQFIIGRELTLSEAENVTKSINQITNLLKRSKYYDNRK